jgi:hypothetical protein
MAVMDNHDDLFGNEGILPAQFYANRGERLNEPERRLILAVLTDAINRFQLGTLSGKPTIQFLGREAAAWLQSDSEGIFSMVWVCEMLDIEPKGLQRRLRAWDGSLGRRAGVQNSVARPTPTLPRYRGHRERGRV